MIIKKINYANIASRQVFHSTLHSKKTHFNSRPLRGINIEHAKKLKALTQSEVENITSLEKLGNVFDVERERARQILTKFLSSLEVTRTEDTNANVKAVWDKLQTMEL